MGFLSGLFGQQDSHERQLEELYVSMFQTYRGIPLADARTMVKQLIEEAKQEARTEGTADTPPDFGDRILANEAGDESTRSMLAAKRLEGVRDEDFRWWWNMRDLERRMMIKDDDLTRTIAFSEHRKNGIDAPAAAALVRQFYPIYGNPSDTSATSGDDRPLP